MEVGCLNKRETLKMENNLFGEIFKYRQSKHQSPLENYCTEIFVYILRKLIDTKNDLSFKILELFGLYNLSKEDLENIKIITREKHYCKDRIVYPDIIIKFNDKINIIEVKVNSGVRNYSIKKNKIINQLKLYKQITDIKINDVFLLSKHVFFDYSIDKSNKVLWSQIHSLLKNIQNEIINNFTFFLEENSMESYIVEKNAENGINSVYALSVVIQNSLESILPKNYTLHDEISWEYNGYHVKNNKNESIAWIGQYLEHHEYIVFVPTSKNLIKKAKMIYENMRILGEDELVFSELKISEITSYSSEKDQIEVIQKWYDKEIKKIFEK